MLLINMVVVGIVSFPFIFDISIGGGILLRYLVLGIPLNLFFVSLTLSSMGFVLLWSKLQLYRMFSQKSLFMIGAIFVFLLVISFGLTAMSENANIFLWITVPLFNFCSFFLFSESVKALSRISFYPKRGFLISLGAVFSLAVGALAIYLGVEQVSSQDIKKTTLVVLGFTLSFLPLFLYLILQGWETFEQYGIDFLGNRKSLGQIIAENPGIRKAVITSSLFLMGSGIAHGVLVQNAIGTQETSRAIAYLITLPFVFALGVFSDRIGRSIILVGAIVLNTTSQILSYFDGNPQLIASFEVAGYYSILIFITLKLSDEISPANWNLIGVAWGIIFVVDFLGGLFATSLSFTARELSMISISLMVFALFLALRTPDPYNIPKRVEGYLVLEKGVVVEEKGIDEKIREQIRRILPSISMKSVKPVELEEGLKAIFSKKGDFTSVAFLNSHSLKVLKDIIEFEIRNEEDNPQKLLQDMIRDFMEITVDIDGMDVKFMEL